MKTVIALVAFIVALATQAQAAQKTVCTVTINSADEKTIFKRNLNSSDFKFVELTDYDDKTNGAARTESQWFKKACESGVQCDVLVVSAHFGGFFFGSSGYQIQVPSLESNSCNNSCDGILKNPKEVFLFGCNTLAEKGKDARTQQEYIDVLIGDGYRPEVATQVAETRYGAVGSTFKDQMRRVFAGVPHIYGFSSVSPSGAHIAPLLNQYFRSIPNYSAHLDEISGTTAVNSTLQASMKSTAMTQTMGVGAESGDPGVPYRKQICSMYNDKSTMAERTGVVAKMLMGNDRFIFLNSVVSFLNQNLPAIQSDYWANDALNNVAKDQKTMNEIDRLEASPTTSISLRLDLMDLEVKLGRLARKDFTAQALSMLKPLVSHLSQAHADLICSALNHHNLKMSVTAADFAPGTLATNAALTVMPCLSTTDEQITRTFIPLVNSDWVRRDGNALRALLLALVRLPGQNAEKVKLANYVNQYVQVFAPYTYGLLTVAQTGQAQLDAAATLAVQEVNNIGLIYDLMQYLPRNEDLSVALLGAVSRAQTKPSRRAMMRAIIKTLPFDSAFWPNVAAEIEKDDEMLQAIDMGNVIQSGVVTPPMANLALHLFDVGRSFAIYHAAALAKADLPRDLQVGLMTIISREPQSGKAGLARWALSTQKNLIPEAEKFSRGSGIRSICEQIVDIYQCRWEKIQLR